MAGYFDRVRETSSTSGTGTFTLAGAATGFRAFSSVFTAATQVVYYCATDGTNWEIGQGTYTLSGTTLSRTNILASSNSGSVVNFGASGFQVFHTWPARAANEIYTINVVDYGATGNGTTDDTVAINAAIAAANAYTGLAGSQRGVRLWFPGGLYLVGATTMTAINGNGIVISGEGRGASTILVSATATTYSVFTLTSGNEYCEIRNLQIFAAGAQTAGAYITTSGANDVIIDSVVMSGAFNGIVINGSSIKVSVTNVVISSTVATGTGIVVNNGAAGDTYLGPRIIMSNSASPVAGISIQATGHTQMTGLNVTHCATGLLINPPSGSSVKYVWGTDCLFDSCLNNGLEINPANIASSTVESVRFQSSWFSGTTSATTNGSGIFLTSAGSAAIVDDIVFDNCRILNNALHGVQLAFGTNVAIIGCTIAGNSQATTQTADGINIAAGITDFRILHNRIGEVGTDISTTPQRWAVNVVAGASTRFMVRHNDLRLNGNGSGTGGAFFNGATASATLNFDVGNNIGGPLPGNAMVAASAAINTAETVLVTAPAGSNGINPGTTYRITLQGTCTSSAANVSTFTIRLGTAGTTADTLIATFTVTSATTGTAIPFKVEILLTFRTVGATGSVSGGMTVLSQGLATGTSSGIAAFSADVFQTASVAAPNTAANDCVLSCTYKSAATTTTSTFQQGQIALDKAA